MDNHYIQNEGEGKRKNHTFDEDNRYIDTHDSTYIHGKTIK